MEIDLFWGQKVKVKVTIQKKHCRRGSLDSCDCWLVLVNDKIVLLADCGTGRWRPLVTLTAVARRRLYCRHEQVFAAL